MSIKILGPIPLPSNTVVTYNSLPYFYIGNINSTLGICAFEAEIYSLNLPISGFYFLKITMLALLLLYIIPSVIQESYSYIFFLKNLNIMKLTVARFSGHSSRVRNIVSGPTILHFRTWTPNFIVVSQGINKNLAAQLRERAPLWSQWSPLPVNPSWVPGSCFRWSQRLATPAIRGVMPFSGLFEHCTHSHKPTYN